MHGGYPNRERTVGLLTAMMFASVICVGCGRDREGDDADNPDAAVVVASLEYALERWTEPSTRLRFQEHILLWERHPPDMSVAYGDGTHETRVLEWAEQNGIGVCGIEAGVVCPGGDGDPWTLLVTKAPVYEGRDIAVIRVLVLSMDGPGHWGAHDVRLDLRRSGWVPVGHEMVWTTAGP